MQSKSSFWLWYGSAGALAIAVCSILMLPSVAVAHPCEREPGHKHCKGDPGGGTDRIPGCVTFDPANPIRGDIVGIYCDGDPTKDYTGSSDSMQVAMNCQFNQFNLYPGGGIGGGGRHIHLEMPAKRCGGKTIA